MHVQTHQSHKLKHKKHHAKKHHKKHHHQSESESDSSSSSSDSSSESESESEKKPSKTKKVQFPADEEDEDKEILKSIEFAEKALNQKMATPKVVKGESWQPVKYDVEDVQRMESNIVNKFVDKRPDYEWKYGMAEPAPNATATVFAKQTPLPNATAPAFAKQTPAPNATVVAQQAPVVNATTVA